MNLGRDGIQIITHVAPDPVPVQAARQRHLDVLEQIERNREERKAKMEKSRRHWEDRKKLWKKQLDDMDFEPT